jgi:GNAT superfamily N-acetyltransferase
MEDDPFLSGIIGRPSFRVVTSDLLNASMFVGNQRCFAYARVPTANIAKVKLLENFGFGVVDTAVQLGCRKNDWRPLETIPLEYKVRFAQAHDRENVEKIASESFIYSRFHLDPEIPNSVADEFKRRWAGNFFTGERGDAMVIAADRKGVAGFLQLINRGETLIIDLIAIAKSHQRKGIATSMIGFAWSQFGVANNLLVGTQIANVPSVRAYQKMGFLMSDSSYVVHYHGPINQKPE